MWYPQFLAALSFTSARSFSLSISPCAARAHTHTHTPNNVTRAERSFIPIVSSGRAIIIAICNRKRAFRICGFKWTRTGKILTKFKPILQSLMDTKRSRSSFTALFHTHATLFFFLLVRIHSHCSLWTTHTCSIDCSIFGERQLFCYYFVVRVSVISDQMWHFNHSHLLCSLSFSSNNNDQTVP